ncbi:hypothetical protein X946_1223 [Burkholderia sp. ABCPW 111]|nr:hypothetical protein X946_1223 [Burkholderia sp. ABCPW 111]
MRFSHRAPPRRCSTNECAVRARQWPRQYAAPARVCSRRAIREPVARARLPFILESAAAESTSPIGFPTLGSTQQKRISDSRIVNRWSRLPRRRPVSCLLLDRRKEMHDAHADFDRRRRARRHDARQPFAPKPLDEVARDDARITLPSDSPGHYDKPAFMYVAFGAFFRNALTRAERSLPRPEIAFAVGRATHFDFAAQHVRTTSDKRYGHDHLVIATGCVPSPECIEGLAEASDHFYQHEPERQLAKRIASIKRGVVFVTVTFPKARNVPHQCRIVPIKTTLMFDDWLRRRDVRKVGIVHTYPTVSQLLRDCLLLQKPTCDARPAIFEARHPPSARRHARAHRSGARDRIFGGRCRAAVRHPEDAAGTRGRRRARKRRIGDRRRRGIAADRPRDAARARSGERLRDRRHRRFVRRQGGRRVPRQLATSN